MAGGNPNWGLLRNDHFAWAPPRAVPAESRHEKHHNESSGAALCPHFRLRAMLSRGGTFYEIQGKSNLGSHGTFYGMFRGGTKGRTRKGFRWFWEEEEWENRGVKVWKGLVACKYFTGQYSCLVVPCTRILSSREHLDEPLFHLEKDQGGSYQCV